MSDSPKWTQEQNQAITEKENNILVSAAAGSGKTAVLVERIIQKIINDKIDIDKLLVVTFTNAAASEMRERVLSSIYDELDKNPDDAHLKRQIVLLGKSNICTIHSFCLDVIRNYFYEIDLPANFKIASNEEIEILKQETLDDVLDDLYESDDPKFNQLIDTYAGYKDDDKIRDLINAIYKFIQSNPFPMDWLDEKIAMFEKKDEGKDFSESVYGKILIDDLNDCIYDAICDLRVHQKSIIDNSELINTMTSLDNDIAVLQDFHNKLQIGWDAAYEAKGPKKLSFPTWKSDKGVQLSDDIQSKRKKIKEKIQKKVEDVLKYPSNVAFDDILKHLQLFFESFLLFFYA